MIERHPMARTTTHQRPRTSFFSRPGVRRFMPFAVITAIALIFIFENNATTKIRLLIPEVSMPLWGALLIAWALGILACAFTLHRRR